jgi:chromosome segregation ATPase
MVRKNKRNRKWTKQSKTPANSAEFNARRLENLNDLRDEHKGIVRDAIAREQELEAQIAAYETSLATLRVELADLPAKVERSKDRLGGIATAANKLESKQENLEKLARLRAQVTNLGLEVKRDDLAAEIEARGDEIKTN